MSGSDLCLSARMGTRISNGQALSIFIISDCSLFVFDALLLPVFHPLHYILQTLHLSSVHSISSCFTPFRKKTACVRNTPAASPSILLYAFLVYPDAVAPFGITHDCAKPSLMPNWPETTWLGLANYWWGLVSHVLLNLILTWTALL